jgi:hypothetical protein
MVISMSLESRQRQALLKLLAGGLCLLLASCGNNGRKSLYHAHGQVFDGQHRPCAGALVIFHPVDPGDTDPAKPYAYVEEDGYFELTTYELGDGAAAGEYVATVIWKPRATSAMDPNLKAPDRLAGRYSKPSESKLRFKIEKTSDNDLPAMNLQ